MIGWEKRKAIEIEVKDTFTEFPLEIKQDEKSDFTLIDGSLTCRVQLPQLPDWEE